MAAKCYKKTKNTQNKTKKKNQPATVATISKNVGQSGRLLWGVEK